MAKLNYFKYSLGNHWKKRSHAIEKNHFLEYNTFNFLLMFFLYAATGINEYSARVEYSAEQLSS